jgi:transcriptional regulator with XRE-family HTH domain
MDVCQMIKQRLEELGLEQGELAAAAEVTESYISQLLNRKKAPPAPERTDIYEKMEKFLKLPGSQLAKLADLQRREEWRKSLEGPSPPLFEEVRKLILRKCAPDKEKQLREIFEKEAFGEVERLVTQKLLDVAKGVAKRELGSENWLRLVARLSGRSYREMRVLILEFLDTDIFHLSAANCVSFLDPLVESWDIELGNFSMEIVLNDRLAPGQPMRFEFVERDGDEIPHEEPGLKEFLSDTRLSGNATEEEVDFLKKLRFREKRPTALYYYRELQNFRDPLHFTLPKEKERRKAPAISP